jgi:hypothetical protein
MKAAILEVCRTAPRVLGKLDLSDTRLRPEPSVGPSIPPTALICRWRRDQDGRLTCHWCRDTAATSPPQSEAPPWHSNAAGESAVPRRPTKVGDGLRSAA